MLLCALQRSANKAHLLSASAPYASSWLSVVPKLGLGLHLDPAKFQIAMMWWLGMSSSVQSVHVPILPRYHFGSSWTSCSVIADMVGMLSSDTIACKKSL